MKKFLLNSAAVKWKKVKGGYALMSDERTLAWSWEEDEMFHWQLADYPLIYGENSSLMGARRTAERELCSTLAELKQEKASR